MTKQKKNIKILLRERLYFLLEILIIFLGLFILMLIPIYVVPLLVPESSVFYEPVKFAVRAFLAVFGIYVLLYASNFIMEPQKRKLILDIDESSAKNFLNLFTITKKNYKYQLLYGILLLFIVFIPLDFFTYLFIPDMLTYSAVSLNAAYISQDYLTFLISVIIIQIFVSVYEETLTRGFLTNRGVDYVSKMSSVIIASFFFGLGHYSYVFNPSVSAYPPLYPFIWFIQTFLVGIILSMFVLRKHWIFPVIFAHALNNIISAHSIWNYLQGNDFLFMTLVLYLPLLIVGIILFIWQYSRIRDSLKIGFKELGSYFKNDVTSGETTSIKLYRICLDLLFGLIIFLIGVIII